MDDPGFYPFYVMVGNPHVCGGMVVSLDPPTIITAAHCVAGAGPSNSYFIGYGDTDRRRHVINPIVDWTIHPLYQTNNTVDMRYDVAIVRLKDPFGTNRHVSRVAIWPPHTPLPPFPRGSLMGHGYTGYDEPEAMVLQRATLDITKFTPGALDVIEAVGDNDTMACHGDSGIVFCSI
ncbi:Tryptase alpha/beta-1 [Apophysomyces sp. BC1034]|nr:Tryptase alpha/beta-1 [Apophysomyces sp. BC1015]KAG0176169.1 Tryptase alpha/beta-1 [Apophysomyces sp. BC1021]KAG0186229.1 Tryptase alpha/beta-1 [Apophysomyces sp. BC1034]